LSVCPAKAEMSDTGIAMDAPSFYFKIIYFEKEV